MGAAAASGAVLPFRLDYLVKSGTLRNIRGPLLIVVGFGLGCCALLVGSAWLVQLPCRAAVSVCSGSPITSLHTGPSEDAGARSSPASTCSRAGRATLSAAPCIERARIFVLATTTHSVLCLSAAAGVIPITAVGRSQTWVPRPASCLRSASAQTGGRAQSDPVRRRPSRAHDARACSPTPHAEQPGGRLRGAARAAETLTLRGRSRRRWSRDDASGRAATHMKRYPSRQRGDGHPGARLKFSPAQARTRGSSDTPPLQMIAATRTAVPVRTPSTPIETAT